MARTNNVIDSYESGSAKDRAELIYTHYCSFEAILSDIKARLIYEIQCEEQFIRSQHKDELGVRIQKFGQHADPTANQAVNNVMLEESIDGDGGLYMSAMLPKETQERLQNKHRVLVVMREEYSAFDKHLKTLIPEEQQIIIPLLKHTKDYTQLSEETGIAIETIRKRVSRIRKEFIEDMTEYFVESIKGGNCNG